MRVIWSLVNGKVRVYAIFLSGYASEGGMDAATVERELVDSMKRFVKAELKRADVTYEELAAKLREMGFEETKVSVSNKLSRGTFPATFFVAVMRAIGRENVNLSDL
jgi:hypothetical protein